VRLYDAFAWLEVGTGTNPPNKTDASLQSPVAPRVNFEFAPGLDRVTYVDGDQPYWKCVRSRQFNETQANGNLTEIGFWTQASQGVLINRTIFKDPEGLPTTVVKTNRDIMNVRYEWRIYPPMQDITGSVVINGTTHTLQVRPMMINGAHSWGAEVVPHPSTFNLYGFANHNYGLLWNLGYWNESINWANVLTAHEQASALDNELRPHRDGYGWMGFVVNDTVFYKPYIGGTFFRDAVSSWGPSVANFPSGIGYFTVKCTHFFADRHHQIRITPKIPKVPGQRLTITTRISWNRHVISEL
jgi:hypothetical protein